MMMFSVPAKCSDGCLFFAQLLESVQDFCFLICQKMSADFGNQEHPPPSENPSHHPGALIFLNASTVKCAGFLFSHPPADFFDAYVCPLVRAVQSARGLTRQKLVKAPGMTQRLT